MEALKFVIVGHVDHGKSTLIGRLLFDTNSLPPDKVEEIKKASKELGHKTEFAYLLDHLEEERQQGITIDTTQVFFKTDKRCYVIIDAPGHVEFVKNMITGASQAHAAILIIDTAEGIQEQTKRHAYILSMLNLKQVIVVLNKMDLIGCAKKGYDKIAKEAQCLLEPMGINPIHYIPISSIRGDNIAKRSENMDWYSGPTLLEGFDSFKNKMLNTEKNLIFPLQDIYKVNGKRISVGRIESGILRKDQEIKVLPSGEVTKVKTIEKLFEDNIDQSSAGESIGITTQDPIFISRGDIICEPNKEPLLTDEFTANIFWMTKETFNKSEKIILRCATQEEICSVQQIKKRINSASLEVIEEDASQLNNLEVGEVLIKTKKPIAIEQFNELQELGRFVLVRGDNVCAGGIIV